MAEAQRQLDHLFRVLESDDVGGSPPSPDALDALRRIKEYGRDPKTATPIFEIERLIRLAAYGVDKPLGTPTSREALRCIANAFLLNVPARQSLVNVGYDAKFARSLERQDSEDEFLLSRILFLLTYETKIDLDVLCEGAGLPENIVRHIARHAAEIKGRSGRNVSAIEDMALTETLKLAFNLTFHCPALVPEFTQAVPCLVDILLHFPAPDPPLSSVVAYTLNVLINMKLEDATTSTSNPLFPTHEPQLFANHLVHLLEQCFNSMSETALEQSAASLITLIRRILSIAAPEVREQMQLLLLPSASDRSMPLGKGDALPARLLRASTSPNLPSLRENIGGLLFELSDQNPSKFVKNIGFGYASGYLMSHNMAIPADIGEVSDTQQLNINPVTGQSLAAEAAEHTRTPAVEMTEEEKEREAEKLFVLFERLKATGVVDVKNPVQQAVDEGRFHELDS